MIKPQRMPYSEALDWLLTMVESGEMSLEWDREKQKIHGCNDADERQWTFLMPLPFPVAAPKESLESYLNRVPGIPEPYFILLIQAGHSSLGYFEEGEVLNHKVIKKYMVRGKGKSQVSYLGKRGKSKAGSRIRLANTVSFFEDINAKLREWDVEDNVARILLACPIRLRPLLFAAKIPPPFDKTDPRILKIPMDIHRPGQDELLRVNRAGLCGYLEGEI